MRRGVGWGRDVSGGNELEKETYREENLSVERNRLSQGVERRVKFKRGGGKFMRRVNSKGCPVPRWELIYEYRSFAGRFSPKVSKGP